MFTIRFFDLFSRKQSLNYGRVFSLVLFEGFNCSAAICFPGIESTPNRYILKYESALLALGFAIHLIPKEDFRTNHFSSVILSTTSAIAPSPVTLQAVPKLSIVI